MIEERAFRGGIADQIRDCLRYLQGFIETRTIKQRDSPGARRWVSYPLRAVRESIVNAVYHRGYEGGMLEPTKVSVLPDRIEIVSYPGPAGGIRPEHLRRDAVMPAVPARNRRIGELLKELRLAEGRKTGLPKIFAAMRANGSPDPRFDFDDGRTYFRVTLPAHPEYVGVSGRRDGYG